MGIFSKELVFGLVGGLGLFLLGLVTLGEGLQKAAGNQLRKTIQLLTHNRIFGLLLGAGLTVLFQSSSVAAVIIIGLLSANIITLAEALVILMGASLGTTIIAQIITFQPQHYALLLIGLGFGLQYLATRRYLRYIGQAVLGFGLVFVGLQTLSHAFHFLSHNAAFRASLAEMGKVPIWGFIMGTLASALLQSSNAAIGLLQSLAQQPVFTKTGYMTLLPLSFSIPILLGSNLGSCATAVAAAVGKGRNAKRAVLAFTVFNLVGSLIVLFFVPSFSRLVIGITSHLAGWFESIKALLIHGAKVTPWRISDMVGREIAMAHTIFTVANILIWLPLAGLLIRLTTKIIPGKDKEPEEGPRYLDEGMLSTPSVAMDLAILEIGHMSEIAVHMLKNARQAFTKGSVQLINEVGRKEDQVDEMQEKITFYLSTLLSNSTLTPSQSRYLAGLLHVVNDVERVGDHANNIAHYAEEKFEEKLPFSELAINELELLFGKVIDILQLSVQSLRNHDPALAKKTLHRESAVDKLEEELRQNHINRLNQGKCWPGSGVIYVELLNNLERVADHAVNIAQVVLEEEADQRQ